MSRSVGTFCLLVVMLAGLSGCSGSASKDSKKPAVPLDKIQGKLQVQKLMQPTAADTAINAGGPSLYIIDGLRRYRLFIKAPIEVADGQQYMAEGVYAQKAIDDIGDPDKGANGYPLPASVETVVTRAWPGLAFDVTAGHESVLRAAVSRYPARPVFLVVHLTQVDSKATGAAKSADDDDAKEVAVSADKQRAALVEGPTTQPAPLWEPKGGKISCKVVIGTDGKISSLETGAQLCEAVPWSQFRYQPKVQGGKPVKVRTEIEVTFEPRK